uniref:Uncharacterized protein n=1 Tax=Oncorhynchus tshawytscha TaxID=74940 RepID=A0AAZ3Q3V3_ONCTS
MPDSIYSYYLLHLPYNPLFTLHDLLKDSVAGDEDVGTTGHPASKKLKLEPEKKTERCQKVDEDDIQKMSSFNCYEMYRRSAFPKAAIKKVRPLGSFLKFTDDPQSLKMWLSPCPVFAGEIVEEGEMYSTFQMVATYTTLLCSFSLFQCPLAWRMSGHEGKCSILLSGIVQLQSQPLC